MSLSTFLTTYDPTDLPGGSVDPLGFEAGYIWLADQILPGLTVAGNAPRYLSVLCAGIGLSNTKNATTPRQMHAIREQTQQRFERLWAVANVLASESTELSASGLRGVSYATKAVELVRSKGQAAIRADGYALLSSQVPYGAVGIYAAVASGMRLIERRTLRLSVDLGEKLAEAFLDETQCPSEVRKAAQTGEAVPLSVLSHWGKRAHVNAPTKKQEARRLREALTVNDTRLRMTRRLAERPWRDGESELGRLKRIAKAIDEEHPDIDLKRAITTIRRWESGYQHALLVLERVLWLCRKGPSPRASWQQIDDDQVLAQIRSAMPEIHERLKTARGAMGPTPRLESAASCIEASASTADNRALVSAVVQRHADVQADKKVRGRPKMPWVELDDTGLSLTLTEIGGLRREAKKPGQITRHAYRTHTADQLRKAAHGA